MDGGDHVDDNEDNLELLDGIYRRLEVEYVEFLEAIPGEDLCEDEQLYLVDGEGKMSEFALDVGAKIDNETPSAASSAESPERYAMRYFDLTAAEAWTTMMAEAGKLGPVQRDLPPRKPSQEFQETIGDNLTHILDTKGAVAAPARAAIVWLRQWRVGRMKPTDIRRQKSLRFRVRGIHPSSPTVKLYRDLLRGAAWRVSDEDSRSRPLRSRPHLRH